MARYFHGGQRGLLIGGYILPPSESGAKNTLQDVAAQNAMGLPARRDSVYLTTARDAALLFAVAHPSEGWVYEVEPEGELRPDPDCNESGLSWECARARIVDVYRPTFGERRQVLRAMGVR